jgi:hypothetical protein
VLIRGGGKTRASSLVGGRVIVVPSRMKARRSPSQIGNRSLSERQTRSAKNSTASRGSRCRAALYAAVFSDKVPSRTRLLFGNRRAAEPSTSFTVAARDKPPPSRWRVSIHSVTSVV